MTERLRRLANKDKPTKVEDAKQASKFLRGQIAEKLADEQAKFDDTDGKVMKFHGIYQQEDRDTRPLARVTGQELPQWFMVRVKIPGGVLTPDQYLAMDQLADEMVYNRSLRITTRQNFQLHGILKGTLKPSLQRINEVLLSTLCGCGDVERNIVAPPAPLADEPHQALRQLARDLTEAMTPNSNAYYEVWLDREKVDSSQEDEPIYGQSYLPRKFKTGLALPEDNSTDVYDQDVGLVGIVEDGKLVGANVLVGGSAGVTHKKEDTYARLASPIGYVDRENLVELVKIIATIFRDYGDRTDRKHARLKYVVEECGVEAFLAELRERANFEIKPSVEIGRLEHRDWLGLHEQGDGRFFYGVYVPCGRVIDEATIRYKTAFRTIVEALRPEVVLTPNQNIIFGNLSEEDVKKLERILGAYSVPKVESLTGIRRNAMACPALPTCGLALTESERIFDDVMKTLEAEFAAVGLVDEPVTVRMTGCPNGCARPYNADIGLVGHKPGHYDLYLGGALRGDRMAEFYAENVPLEQLPQTLRPLLEAWAEHRQPDEPLGDFYDRAYGRVGRRDIVTGSKENPAAERIDFTQLTVAVS